MTNGETLYCLMNRVACHHSVGEWELGVLSGAGESHPTTRVATTPTPRRDVPLSCFGAPLKPHFEEYLVSCRAKPHEVHGGDEPRPRGVWN